MSKAVKWQIPFVSTIEKTKYRIDIYAEGYSGNPIQLLGGPQPFVTEENKSDDFFTPVRSQTGNIQVCTAIPAGGTLSLDDILPANNIDHPVRLVSIRGNTETIEWQGFLSCEAYSQSYTSIPQILTLPVISVLEAWKSAYYTSAKIETVAELLSELFSMQIGVDFTGLILPEDYTIAYKFINTSIFVERQEYQNEESTVYTTQGSSAYDILTALCKFMGWTAREQWGALYLEIAQGNGLIDGTVTRNMSDLVWRGNRQQRTVVQGRRVGEVVANLKELDIETGIPGIPFGSFNDEKFRQIGTGGQWVYFLPSESTNAFSNIVLNSYAGALTMGIDNDPSHPYSFQRLGSVGVATMIQNSIPYMGYYPALQTPTTGVTVYAGACFARMQFDAATDPDTTHTNTTDGLFVSLFPCAYVNGNAYTDHIFEMKCVQIFASNTDGYFNISSALKIFIASPWVGISQSTTKMAFDFQVGGKIWNGNAWTDASGNTGKFLVEFAQDGTKLKGNWSASMDIEENDCINIPNWYTENGVKKHVSGLIVLRLYPQTYSPDLSSKNRSNFECNVFFSELSVDYIMKKSVRMSDRSNNNYRRTINTQFAEDISIDTDLASWHNNNPSPSLLYNEDGQTPMSVLSYATAGGGTTTRRPEVDLLDRMQAYYNVPRSILSLQVAPITDKPLPLIRLNGINDGKVYLPLAESRDWIADVATLTCFETPN